MFNLMAIICWIGLVALLIVAVEIADILLFISFALFGFNTWIGGIITV